MPNFLGDVGNNELCDWYPVRFVKGSYERNSGSAFDPRGCWLVFSGLPLPVVSISPGGPLEGQAVTRDEMQFRRLLAEGMVRNETLKQSEIPKLFQVSRATASRWIRAIRQGQSLKKRTAPGRPCRLMPHELEQLKAEVNGCGICCKGLAQLIETRFQVRYSIDHVSRIMRDLGIRNSRVI